MTFLKSCRILLYFFNLCQIFWLGLQKTLAMKNLLEIFMKKTAIDKSNRCYNYKSDKKGGKFYVKWKSYHNSF